MRERMQGPGIRDSYANRIIGFTMLNERMSIRLVCRLSSIRIPCHVFEYVRFYGRQFCLP